MNQTSDIVKIANKLVATYGTRNPYKLAQELGIIIMPRAFQHQLGVFKTLLNNRFIFIKEDLDPVMADIVLLHEIGHAMLHASESKQQCFQEFNIFNMKTNRMEYEANIFASQIALPDDDILFLIKQGYDIQQVAGSLNSDINLVALKVDTLISQGYLLRPQEHTNDFLKYDKIEKSYPNIEQN